MANVYVTIGFANGHLSATPDEAMVSASDTVIWQLSGNLHWPPLPGKAIAYLSGTHLITSVVFVSGTIQGTVSSTAAPDQEESYNVTVNSGSEYEEELVSTHVDDDETFDPKIKVKIHVES